jgi:uncharacterized protein YxjI
MSQTIILEDKMIQSGSSPIYTKDYSVIGHIHYYFFSLRNKIEVKDANSHLIAEGSAKLMTLLPKWEITDSKGNVIGQINRKFTFFQKRYQYHNRNNQIYMIEGNFWDRRFNVMDNRGHVVIKVSTLSSIISLRPHTFLIEIMDDTFDLWEAINIIQGVRSLVKAERNND